MKEALVLGLVQGIVEWLPISSEGAIVLTKVYLFESTNLTESIELALFLHLGTFFSALVYFYRDVWELLKGTLNYRTVSSGLRRTIIFILVATLISGALGYGLILSVETLERDLALTGKAITALVGVLLLITGFAQLGAGEGGTRIPENLNWVDSTVLGVAQGLAALPGISRSGMTVSALLLLNYEEEQALRLSFLLSLPIVLGANVILNLERFFLSATGAVGLVSAFVSGLLTIHFLLELAQKINFGYFVLLFGGITLLAVFV